MDGAPEAAPRYRVGSSHSGADFEAGRLGHRNGEAPNDGAEHEVVNAHEPEPTRSGSGAGQRSINSFLSGAGRGRVGRGLGRLGCGYNDRIAQVPAACWMPVLYLGARVYVVNIGPMLPTLTR